MVGIELKTSVPLIDSPIDNFSQEDAAACCDMSQREIPATSVTESENISPFKTDTEFSIRDSVPIFGNNLL